MDLEPKTPRRRVANFTADEKALLAHLIKCRPIVESKLSDGKSVIKKKAAWDLITQEFNSNASVHKRDTISLKRAWDNMKAFTRKARATERGNLLRTGGGPSAPPPPSQQGAIISMVEEAAPVIICEVKNTFDSDGSILSAIKNGKEEEENFIQTCYGNLDILEVDQQIEEEKLGSTDIELPPVNPQENLDKSCYDNTAKIKKIQVEENIRKPSDYIRREAVLRLKSFENKKKIELQILKIQLESERKRLEVEEIRKRAALLEEERNENLLKISKLGLEKFLKNDK